MARSALDLTYVLYDETSHLSHALALLTLTPILTNPAYAALVVQTREILYIEMYAGQLLCEAFNYVLKHIIQEERPNLDLGDGYGFPSSHSQWMGYFASFLFCHFTFRHRFVSTGSRILDILRTIVLYWGIATVAGAVAYSRYHLTYHTARQVFWGFTIGIIFGTFYYSLVELIPARKPQSVLGRVKISLLSSPLFTWFRLRDSWDVWPDGGMEVQYGRWRAEWDAKRLGKDKKVS